MVDLIHHSYKPKYIANDKNNVLIKWDFDKSMVDFIHHIAM